MAEIFRSVGRIQINELKATTRSSERVILAHKCVSFD